MERPSLNVLSPSSPGTLQDAPQLMPGQLSVSDDPSSPPPASLHPSPAGPPPCVAAASRSAALQVKLWYDKVGHQLIVNVLQAAELSLRPDGRPRSPYVKMYFLPDRRYAPASHQVYKLVWSRQGLLLQPFSCPQ